MFQTVSFTQSNMRGCVILLGGFDGLHVGHRKLLARAKEYRLPVGVMTIVGGKSGGSLFTLREREKVFENAGVDFVFELPFGEIREMSPEQFVKALETQFEPTAFVCGEDFRFGKSALGTPERLRLLTKAQVDVLPLMQLGGEKVSSSTVKRLLGAGDLSSANELLGEPFFLLGRVVSGRQVGRTIGFPTANMAYPSEKFSIPLGVYETSVSVDGADYKGITNFGAKPTFSDGQVCVETYIDGFSGDIYGREILVQFVRKIRDIQKFESVEKLQRQLQMDLASIRG